MLVIRDAFEAEDATGDDGSAGCHGFDEYEAEAFLARVGGAEYVGVLVVGWQFFVGDGAGEMTSSMPRSPIIRYDSRSGTPAPTTIRRRLG